MIKSQLLNGETIDCTLEGGTPVILVEYYGITTSIIKRLRGVGNDDKAIKEILTDAFDTAFKVLNKEGAVREVQDDKEKDNIVNYHPGI